MVNEPFSPEPGTLMARPRALIFDCDGTLADTMPSHYQAWVATLTRHGATFTETQFYAMGGWPTQRVSEWLVREHRMAVVADIITREKEARFEQILYMVEPVEAVMAIAQQGRGRWPMAVATGGMRRICEAILRHLGCIEWFDTIVCCEDVPRHKPAPDIFLEAARRLNVPPAECLVYEDTNPGIEAAQAAGMAVIDVRGMGSSSK
jgi:beta-phosphoglucomutase-like phosphatase (HAD superfamily)